MTAAIRNYFAIFVVILFVTGASADVGTADIVISIGCATFVISTDGRVTALRDNKSEQNWLDNKKDNFFAMIRKQGVIVPVSSLVLDGSVLRALFGQSGIVADFTISPRNKYLVIELTHLEGQGVEEVFFPQLHCSRLVDTGSIVVARSNKEFTVSSMGLSDLVHSRIQAGGSMVSSVYAEHGQIGEKVAIVAAPTIDFLEVVERLEQECNLPSPKIGGAWAKRSEDVRTSYLFADMTEANADEMIRYAKLGGFKYIMIYASTWASSLGSYPINRSTFPRGEAGLQATVAKCNKAGLKVGLHMLTSFIGKKDPLVTPKPDQRLLKDGTAVLTSTINEKQQMIPASDLHDFPLEGAFYGLAKAGTDILIDDEIIHYESIDGGIFTKCIRGFNGTRPARHAQGAKVHHLTERYGSYLADLRTTLKEDIAERVAGVINRCGIDMIYFDGGEVNSLNGPFWYWGSQQQLSIWKKVKRGLLVQGMAITPWTWHIFSRATCDDYAAIIPKQFLDYHKIPIYENYRKNFLPAELGWWAFLSSTDDHPATTPDEAEHYAVRMLAYGAPVSLEATLQALRKNERSEEMLRLLSRYEHLRLDRKVPQKILDKLKTGEWRLSEGGIQAFHPVLHQTVRADAPGRFEVDNKFDAQTPWFRVQAVPGLSRVEDKKNIPLVSPSAPVELLPVAATAPMPGFLSASRVFGQRLDLSRNRGLAVTVEVEKTIPEIPSVLNIQLESTLKFFRDHFVNLDFVGRRTVILPDPNPQRMFPDLVPKYENYSLKAALYSFDYGAVQKVNFRWMQGPGVRCRITNLEALAENDLPLEAPEVSLGTQPARLPLTLKPDQYIEWSSKGIRIFDHNGKSLGTQHYRRIPNASRGSNMMSLGWSSGGGMKVTTRIEGAAVPF